MQAQDRVQRLVRLFLHDVTAHSLWEQAQDLSLLSIPLAMHDWKVRPYLSHIVPIRTQAPYHYWLFFHLTFDQFSVFPVDYPTVAKGQSRLKVTFHAKNTEAEVKRLVSSIYGFVQEVIDIQNGSGWGNEVPGAARRVYEWMAKEKLTGFGIS